VEWLDRSGSSTAESVDLASGFCTSSTGVSNDWETKTKQTKEVELVKKNHKKNRVE
jgi:hypothetical protein